jgi:hypothetical protein
LECGDSSPQGFALPHATKFHATDPPIAFFQVRSRRKTKAATQVAAPQILKLKLQLPQIQNQI